MRKLLNLTLLAALSSLGACVSPPHDASAHADHGSHGATPGDSATGCPAPAGDRHAMHERMMAARTPQEREAMHAEHMKAMQAGMAASGPSGTGGMKRGMGGSDAMAGCPAMPASAPAAR